MLYTFVVSFFSTSSLRIVFKLLYVMSLYLFVSVHLFLFVSLHNGCPLFLILSIYFNSGNASKILQTPKDVRTNWKSQNNDIRAVNGMEAGCIQLTLSFSSFIALFAPDLFIVFWQSSLGLPGACSALVN